MEYEILSSYLTILNAALDHAVSVAEVAWRATDGNVHLQFDDVRKAIREFKELNPAMVLLTRTVHEY